MRVLYCIWAGLLALAVAAPPASAQAPESQGPTGYMIFVRGVPVGREEVTVRSTGNGTAITGSSRLAPPVDLVLERGEVVYHQDGSPASLSVQGTSNAAPLSLTTSFENGTAVTRGSQGRQTVDVSHPFTPGSVVLANGFFGSYAGLAMRLESASAGTIIPAYLAPAGGVQIRVNAVGADRMQVATRTFVVRRFDVSVLDATGEVPASLTTMPDGTLLRLTVPSEALEILREDLATSTARTSVYANAGDEAVVIPGAGFNIGATITRPAAGNAAHTPWPAVILQAGSQAADRDGVIGGVPIMGELAGALADAGFFVVRYDRRGYGQSGGRAESAALGDYADDLRSVVRWTADRDDVDKDRVAVAGHGDGAWIAMLAASREKRIAGVVALAAPSSTGADLVLEQQQRSLDLLTLSPQERTARVDEQKQINEAVISGKGLDKLPANVRREADTPWFQSVLTFDPAKVLGKMKQPLLIVQGSLDTEVPAAHADRLANLARTRGKSRSVDVVIVKGANHLLIPAKTGAASEYATLPDHAISPDVTMAIDGWLTKTLTAR
jgi:alpha-beta hydrolase superfamily lysophospholipase